MTPKVWLYYDFLLVIFADDFTVYHSLRFPKFIPLLRKEASYTLLYFIILSMEKSHLAPYSSYEIKV